MALLQKLSKKDAIKYNFTLTIDCIQPFTISEDEEKRKSIKLPFDKRGSMKLFNKKQDEGTRMVYAIFWKRGNKRNGKTKFLPISRGKLVVNDVFSFNGTMFKTKKGFIKKKLKFDIHERPEGAEEANTGDRIGSGELNLGEFCEDHEGEETTPVELTLNMKKGSGVLKLSITSSISDDPASTSTFTGSDGDTSEMTDTSEYTSTNNTSKGKNKKKSAAVSVLETENADLREQNLLLRKKVEELETACMGESDSAELVLELQRERDGLRQKLKQTRLELDQMKEERDRAMKETQETKRARSISHKLQKGIGDITSKVTFGVVNIQDDKSEESNQTDVSVEKILELEKENQKLKQQLKRAKSNSDSSDMNDDDDDETEKLRNQVSELRKKLANVDLTSGKKGKKDKKKVKNSETIAGYIEDEITQFINEEVVPLLPNSIFRNQQQFTYADVLVSKLAILKTLFADGTLSESYLTKLVEQMDNELFRTLIKKQSLKTNDGFMAKLTISVYENYLLDLLGETKDVALFHRSRQCADICVLNKPSVLKSDETRRLVAPNLEFTEVKVICQKLGLVN